MPDVDFDIRGFDETTLEIQGIEQRVQRQIKDILSDAGWLVASLMRARIPKSDDLGPGHVHTADTIEVGMLGWNPGGAGGGGMWSLTVTVGDESTPQLQFFTEGTGIYAGRGMIEASPGNVMPIDIGAGDPIFRPRQKGQPAQTEWLESSQQEGREFIAARIHLLDLKG